VDEPGPGIVPHTAPLQPEGGLPQRREARFGDPEVDRLPLEVEAVSGYALSTADEFLVVLRGPEPGDDVDVVSAAQAPVHGAQEVDHPQVHLGDLLGVVAAQDAVHGGNRLRDALPPSVPVVDGEPFAGVGVEDGEPPFRAGGYGPRGGGAWERLSREEEERAPRGGLQNRPSIETRAMQRFLHCANARKGIAEN